MKVIIGGIEYVPYVPMRIVSGNTLASLFKMRRLAYSWSLEVAAAKIGCSKSHLWALENIDSLPSLGMALALMECYDISFEALESAAKRTQEKLAK